MISGVSVRVAARSGAWLRSARCSAEILVVLVVAHTWAGGSLPSLGWVVAVAALMTVGGVGVLRGRVSPAVAVPVLTAAQLLLHSWMAVLDPAHAAGSHAHHGVHQADGAWAALGLSLPMVLAHVAGALVTALVWELRHRAVEVVLAWSDAGVVPPPGCAPVPAQGRRTAVRRPQRPVSAASLRGPPVATASR